MKVLFVQSLQYPIQLDLLVYAPVLPFLVPKMFSNQAN